MSPSLRSVSDKVIASFFPVCVYKYLGIVQKPAKNYCSALLRAIVYFKCELSADSVQDPIVNGVGGRRFYFFWCVNPKIFCRRSFLLRKNCILPKIRRGGPPLDLPLRQATILLTTGHKVQPFIVQLACIRYN